MALTIGDAAVTAVLEDPGVIGLARGGWAQAGPEQLPDGRFGDVAEALRLEWYSDADDAARAALLQQLGRLDQRARANEARRRLRFIPPADQVVLTGATPTEALGRYAIVRSLALPRLDPRHRAAAGPVAMQLQLVREGLWRGIRPGDPMLPVLPTTAVPNAGANYVTIPPASIPGDAPALTRIQVEPLGIPADSPSPSQTNQFYIMVARLTANSLAELDAFSPYLWASDKTPSYPYQANETLASYGYGLVAIPGGEVLAIDALSQSGNLRWDVDAAGYNGPFQVYGISHAIAAGQAERGPRMGLLYGWADAASPNAGALVDTAVYTQPYWGMNHLGTFQFPPGNLILDQMGAFYFQIVGHIGHYTDMALAGLMFIPAGEQTMSAWFDWDAGGASPDTLIFDGERRRSYGTKSGNLVQTAVNHEGPYIELEPGKYNRLFFYHVGRRVATIPYWLPQLTWNVQVHIIPRFQYLRG